MKPLEQLSRFAAGVCFTELPDEVRDQAGWILLDSIGAIVGGSAEPEMRSLSDQLAGDGMWLGRGDCAVLGHGRGASADVAALLNGTAGTFLEMDEGNRFSRGHPAIHVIPAALALCEQRGDDAPAFLSAVVVGYEVGSRIGAASRLRASMHPHGTWGTIGAAA
ncbi:MAG: MmgE/PrpD family protein, partial [Burkholderiaceae bacterium]